MTNIRLSCINHASRIKGRSIREQLEDVEICMYRQMGVSRINQTRHPEDSLFLIGSISWDKYPFHPSENLLLPGLSW
jgi:hypothetical protein